MQRPNSFSSKNKVSIAIAILMIAGFFLLLTTRLNTAVLAYFHKFSVPVFLGVILSYFLAFRTRGKFNWLAAFGLTLLFFGLTLSYVWTSGFTDNGILGGLLPYKDGRFYYWSSQMLMNGERISTLGNQGYERPLFPGFLSFFLLVTQSNLKWSLAIIVVLTAVAAYLATRCVFEQWGPTPASIFATFLYFYIQSLLGYNNSELPGFIFGCLGFTLLWRAGQNLRLIEMILGLISTMVAVSARAGAFFIYPALILWAGWAFRKERRFSYSYASIVAGVVLAAFLAFNVIYPRLVVEPGGVTFGNFAFMFYGQARGGTGWTEGFAVTGTKDPKVIMEAAIDFFRRHPFSLVIGSLKAIRDFFMPMTNGIFPFKSGLSVKGITHFILWSGSIASLTVGLLRTFRERTRPLESMLLACFVGIFFSIPFLPPIDGGGRFYAGTMAFFFAPIALGINTLLPKPWNPITADSIGPLRILSTILITLTILIPVSLRLLSKAPEFTIPDCPESQVAFASKVNPGSYIDLIPATQLAACNLVSNVCLNHFETNATDKKTDDFYKELVAQAESLNEIMRIVPYHDFTNGGFHYYVGTQDQLPLDRPDHLVTGCATEIRTQHQSIYKIESITAP